MPLFEGLPRHGREPSWPDGVLVCVCVAGD
jgi:hypothetical protein